MTLFLTVEVVGVLITTYQIHYLLNGISIGSYSYNYYTILTV